MSIVELWNDDISIEWWKMLLIGIAFLTINIIIFLAMWYYRRNVVIECGYPKRNRKSIKKKISAYSFVENILLLRLTVEAEKKCVLIYINLICHFLSIIALAISVCGFVGCMITLAEGWSLMLLSTAEIGIMLITVAFEFVPHLIWLPSERKRYRIK